MSALPLPYTLADPEVQGNFDALAQARAVPGSLGIPALVNGQGLLWDGTKWVATDMATQAELDAHKTSGDHDGRYLRHTPGTARRFTHGTVTFGGFSPDAFSDAVTINHGLGATPVLVIVSNQEIPGSVSVVGYSANFTSTQFRCYGKADNSSFTGTIVHSWIALV